MAWWPGSAERVLRPSGAGLSMVETRLGNGHALDGCEIPAWNETVALAKRAHREAVAEFATLCRNLALTARRLVIFEANPCWNPHMQAAQILSHEKWQRVFG